MRDTNEQLLNIYRGEEPAGGSPLASLTEEEKALNFEIGRTYNRMTSIRHNALRRDIEMKISIKERAIEALPTELREEALEPDFSLFPLDRWVMTHTPPIEGFKRFDTDGKA
jgi:hypothetical protein